MTADRLRDAERFVKVFDDIHEAWGYVRKMCPGDEFTIRNHEREAELILSDLRADVGGILWQRG